MSSAWRWNVKGKKNIIESKNHTIAPVGGAGNTYSPCNTDVPTETKWKRWLSIDCTDSIHSSHGDAVLIEMVTACREPEQGIEHSLFQVVVTISLRAVLCSRSWKATEMKQKSGEVQLLEFNSIHQSISLSAYKYKSFLCGAVLPMSMKAFSR